MKILMECLKVLWFGFLLLISRLAEAALLAVIIIVVLVMLFGFKFAMHCEETKAYYCQVT